MNINKFFLILKQFTRIPYQFSVAKQLMPNRVFKDKRLNQGEISQQSTLSAQSDNDGLTSSESEIPSLLNSQTLHSVFSKAECCTVDGLNEYDDDFTDFIPLGDLITHEMRQTEERLAKQASNTLENRDSVQLASGQVRPDNVDGIQQ